MRLVRSKSSLLSHIDRKGRELWRAVLLISTTLFAMTPVSSAGDTLRDIMDSDEMRQLEATGGHSAARKPITDGDPMSNYSSIWRERKSPRVILSWLDISSTGYKSSDPVAGIYPEHAGAETTLRDAQGNKIRLVVQIPKPMYAKLAQHNSLNSFRRFRPPMLEVRGSDSVDVHGQKADLYREPLGQCSLVMDIERFGILVLAAKKCSDYSPLVKLAKSLNIRRLNQKLTS